MSRLRKPGRQESYWYVTQSSSVTPELTYAQQIFTSQLWDMDMLVWVT